MKNSFGNAFIKKLSMGESSGAFCAELENKGEFFFLNLQRLGRDHGFRSM